MFHTLLRLALLGFAFLPIAAQTPASKLDNTPRLGLLVPVGPPDYAVLLDALKDPRIIPDGPFTYRAGTISGVPVVLIIQPSDGDVIRSLGAQEMLRAFNIRALIYAGTSGGHLPKGEMAIGDIVLGAQTVNHANYYLSPKGEIEPGAFDAMQRTIKHYGPLFADPQLLSMLACSAHRVAEQTTLPAWVEPARPDAHPGIFFYGIQGSSSIWSDNRAYTDATMKVFHEIDEDGDWPSALVATLWKVPFIEVSIISNSIYAFPNQNHGAPLPPHGLPNSHVLAQRISNRIALDLIANYGKSIMTGSYTEPTTNPFPAGVFATPKHPRGLLADCK